PMIEDEVPGVCVVVTDLTEHMRKDEIELRKNEERLRLAVDVGRLGAWEWHIPTGEVVWNDEHYRVFGYEPDEVAPSYDAWRTRVHPGDLAAIEGPLKRSMAQGGDYLAEYRALWPDGTVRWLETRGRSERDATGQAIRSYGVLVDITERKRSEEALKRSEERYRDLIKYAPAGIYEVDFRIPRFTSVNDVMCQYLGYSREELLSMNPFDIMDEKNASLFRRRIRRQLNGEEIDDSIEYQVRAKDGREYDAVLDVTFTYEDGKPKGALVIAHDITERKRAEESLRENQMLLSAIIENTPDPVYVKDVQSRIVMANRALAKVAGKPLEKILGKTDSEYYGDLSTGQLLREHDLSVMKSGQSEVAEETVPTPQGYRTFLSTKTPYRNASGEIIGITGISRDVTEHQQMVETLRKNEERFEILSETASRLLATDEPQNAVKELCQRIMAFLDCHAFFNYLVDEEKGRLHLNTYAGIPEEAGKEIEWLDYGTAVCGCAARDACRIVAEDIPNTPDVRTELVKSFGIKAYACHPLFSAGRVMGTLSFGTRSRTTFTEEELSVMKTVADQVAIAMERIRLIEALEKSRDELEMRVQERTEELAAINEALRTENDERLRIEVELRESEDRLRELSAALLNAQERERKLIAQEIHDSMGSSLAAAKFKMEDALKEMVDSNSQARTALENVIPILQGTIEEARRIQMSLRPSMLDDLGILATINWFCRQFQSTYSRIGIKQEIDIQEQDVPESLKIVIYRILQEGLNNIAKHCKAAVVLLSLRRAKTAIQLVIRDSGQGFDLKEAYSRKSSAKGLGLDSMRERVELSGGFFEIETAQGKGTVIRASWPIESRPNEETKGN
ncbi:MAG TPA: PAS domain S-box protein, partial [Thermodesulfobacteriota bacterium]|nr:PAS domain S-box protein [Thermodesulfobacteriota bacterium]